MSDARKYTLKDLQDAKRLGIQEGIEQAQEVVRIVDGRLIEDMERLAREGNEEGTKAFKNMHSLVWSIYLDLIVIGEKVR